MIEDVDCTQVGNVDYIDERLEVIGDVDCVHIADVDCICILDVNLQC